MSSRRKTTTTPVPEREFVSQVPGGRYSIKHDKLVRLLYAQGWLAYSTEHEALEGASDQELRTCLLAYQHFHGLDTDGWAGPITQRSLEEPRFCSLPDVMPLQQDLCRWRLNSDSPRILWNIQGRLPGLDDASTKDAFAWAWAQWAEVAFILPEYTTDANQAQVLITFDPIDRSGGTLAWSELPCSPQTQRLKQQFDSQEAWVVAERPRRLEIDLGRVACHEIGHVLGLPHLASGNLLQPTYDPNIRGPQAGDVQEIVARYGKPRPGTPPPVPTGGRVKIVLEIEGRLVGGELPNFRLVPSDPAS
jgi:hypothetical protein